MFMGKGWPLAEPAAAPGRNTSAMLPITGFAIAPIVAPTAAISAMAWSASLVEEMASVFWTSHDITLLRTHRVCGMSASGSRTSSPGTSHLTAAGSRKRASHLAMAVGLSHSSSWPAS